MNKIRCILLVTIVLSSCIKNESYLEPPRLFGYAGSLPGNPFLYNQQSYTQLVFRDSVASNYMAFPVKLFGASGMDIQMTASIDVSLVPAYDRLANPATHSVAPPAGAFTLSDSAVLIKAGTNIAPDSIQLKLADATRLNLPPSGQTFIVPVRLHSATPGILPVSDTLRQTMFFQVFVTRVWSFIPSDYKVNYLQVVRQTDGSWIPNNAFLKGIIGFYANINNFIESPLTIDLVPDPSLVAGFNMANGTAYMPLPPASYTIANNGIRVNAGSTATNNAYYIQLTPAFVPKPGPGYLLPLRIKNEGIVAPGQDSTAYIAVTTDPQTIYARTNWRIIAASSEDIANGKQAANLLDGDYGSAWGSYSDTGAPGLPQWFTLDMGQLNQVKGILFRHYVYAGPTTQPRQLKIYASTDQVNWDAGQEITIAAASSPGKNLYIDLPASVQARYIRCEVLSAQADPAGAVSAAEFGLY